MTRQALEKFQILAYLAAIASGLAVGLFLPSLPDAMTVLLWPLLALLLYATFTQIPLIQIRHAFSDRRFMLAALTGNFFIIPVMLWGLMHWLPADPVIRIGVLLVLLAPCTDWFITFTHLGGGDTQHAIAFAPASLLMQALLLPLYLWLFLGETFAVAMVRQEMFATFAGLIVLPLLAAWLTRKLGEDSPRWRGLPDRLAWFPVPLLAVVVFLIAVTQVNLVMASLPTLLYLLLVFSAFLVTAGLLARWLASLCRLPSRQGRTLAFSLGTRNSFVVLPLALALPATYELAVVAIVFQSLVELVGMLVFLWWVPKRLFPG